jgi:cystathionine gamma-synthase
MQKKMRLESLLVHAGADIDSATGAITPPIHLSTTFEHQPDGELLKDYIYIRTGNPTQTRLEHALAAIEGGEASLTFASGLAAGAAYLQSFPKGTHVLYHKDIYFGFSTTMESYLPKWGMESTAVDATDPGSVRSAIRENTKVIWVETPTNPLMQVIDIAELAQIAHEADAKLVVDNTFATPVLQRPIELKADVVVHSLTKYLGGHSDVQGGALVFREKDAIQKDTTRIRETLGGVLSPFNAWLILRGIRSLACRMERHCSNALAIARQLEDHPQVERVYYPGLASHPGFHIAKTQMDAFGGMLSLLVVGGFKQAVSVASRVKLFINATSLGGTESLIEHRASVEGPDSKTPQNLLRVSVGLESVDDLIEDLVQALDAWNCG